MTPQEAVSAFFNTMRSETDQAGLMYSQFAVVQALDYVIDRWEDLIISLFATKSAFQITFQDIEPLHFLVR